MAVRSSGARVESDLDRAVVWLGGACVAAGAVGGFFVGWLYGRDQATSASSVPWYAVVGLLVGAVLGLFVSIGAIVVLVAVDGRRWAASRPLRAVLAGAGAALPGALLLEVPAGFAAAPEALVFCVAVAALPAGLATALLDRRTGRPDARPVS